MFKTIFSKKNIPFLLLDIVLFLGCFLFVKVSFGRFVFILVALLFYVLFSFVLKNRVLAALLFIFSTLPFNITYQLPSTVEVLGTKFFLYDPYVNGVIVNYLVPTVSIIDVGIFLLLYSVLFTYGFSSFKRVFVKLKYWLISLLLFFVVQAVWRLDTLFLLNSCRIVGVLFSFFLVFFLIRDGRMVFSKRFTNIFLLVLLINVFVQGVIAWSQLLKGSSLGFTFLGESQVVSGMRGSSFVEFGGKLFLRGYGTFPHPNILAGFFLLASIIAFTSMFKSAKYTKLVSILILFFSSIFVLFTLSRIVICLFLFNYLTVFLWKMYERYSGKKMFSFEFMPLLYLVERFSNIFNADDSSLVEREKLMIASFRVIEKNFFLGTGSFVRGMAEFVPRSIRGIMILQPVHNVMLLSLSELGVVGFLLFWGIIIKFLCINIKRFTFLTFIILVNVLVIGSFDHYFFSLPQGLLIFFSFLLLSVLNSYSFKEYEYDIEKE